MIVRYLFILVLVFTSCKSAKQKACEKLQSKQTLNINTYEELINFEVGEIREVNLLILDGRIASKEILEKLIFNTPNAIVEVQSIIGSDGSTLDGEPKRALIIKSNLCNQWRIKKGELIIKYK